MLHLNSLTLLILLLAWPASQAFRVRKRENLSHGAELGQRSGRFLNPFSLFHVVQFPNTDCVTGADTQGTCYTASECSTRGGTADGTCASGFGVCCSFDAECDTTTSQNGTYFTSPDTLPSVCSLMITPLDDDICQVRVEFESLSLMDPDEDGKCKSEYVQLTGGVTGTSIPTLCGTLDGQHVIYTPITNFPARLSVVLDTNTVTSSSTSWRMKVLQYSCDSPVLAPDGCLQYFTGISGNVSSFNFKTEDNANTATYPNHIADLNYNICLRRESGYCAVEWSTGSPYNQKGLFSISGDEATLANPIPDGSLAENGDGDCQTDYVMIPQGGDAANPEFPTRDRFCGLGLGLCSDTACNPGSNNLGAVYTTVLPFTLGVVTDSDETGDVSNRGFMLQYKQQPCA